MTQDYRKSVFRAMDYISQHLDLNPTLKEVSREVAVSCYHFHRIFKAQVGETVAEFTRRLRMEKAAMSLIDAPHSDITGLALQVGFSSSQNFARAFRRHFPYRRAISSLPSGGNKKQDRTRLSAKTPILSAILPKHTGIQQAFGCKSHCAPHA